MIAADQLRTALDDAPTLRVEADAHNELTLWDEDDQALTNESSLSVGWPANEATLRLLGLLLAAAPHLAALLVLPPDGPSAPRMADLLGQIDAAITEAGESL